MTFALTQAKITAAKKQTTVKMMNKFTFFMIVSIKKFSFNIVYSVFNSVKPFAPHMRTYSYHAPAFVHGYVPE